MKPSQELRNAILALQLVKPFDDFDDGDRGDGVKSKGRTILRCFGNDPLVDTLQDLREDIRVEEGLIPRLA